MSSRSNTERRRILPNKKTEINWDVLGFSSAAITLLGAGVLYLIGWAYISNWYLYFGVNIEQVNIQVQQVMSYSMPIIISTVAFIPLALLIALLSSYIKALIRKESKGIFAQTISLKELIIIHLLFIVLDSLGGYYIVFGDINGAIFQMPFELTNLLMATWGVAFFLIMIVYIRFVESSPSTIGEMLDRNFRFVPILHGSQEIFSGINRWSWVGITTFIYLLSLLSFSAGRGYIDAALGRKGNSGEIQKVFFVSPKPLDSIKEFEKSCGLNGGCAYGSFGLLTENELSFYLVEWRDGTSERIQFPQNPGVYIMPRSDQNGSYFIIPASSKIDNTPTPLLIPSKTLTPRTTFTATPMVSPTIIFTATLTASQP